VHLLHPRDHRTLEHRESAAADQQYAIIVADIVAVAIDESFIDVVEFGLAGRSPDRAVAIYGAGF
jgi:hypothetical protein